MRQAIAVLVLLPLSLLAQDKAPTGGRPQGPRIGTATVTVVKYTGLERELLAAQQGQDLPGMEKFLSPDFEVWSAESPSPNPKADWQQEWMHSSLKDFRIRGMAVREFGDLAVVSFLLDRQGTAGGKMLSPTVFVVDVWHQSSNKLAVRYESSPALARSGQLRPTGKE